MRGKGKGIGSVWTEVAAAGCGGLGRGWMGSMCSLGYGVGRGGIMFERVACVTSILEHKSIMCCLTVDQKKICSMTQINSNKIKEVKEEMRPDYSLPNVNSNTH
ncbi:hypothetical protein S83_021810 [Arachis hypogaea]